MNCRCLAAVNYVTGSGCYLNLGFVLDGSGSVCESDPSYKYATNSTCSDWQNILSFVQQIVSQFTIGPYSNEVAVEYFSDSGSVVIFFSATTDKTALLNAIASIPFQKYGNTPTYFEQGLTVAATQLFNKSTIRPDASNTMIIVTDGPDPSNQTTFQNAINLVYNSGIKTYAVGIGGGVSDSTLQQLVHTSPQHGVNYFHAPDFSTLGEIAQSLVLQVCVGVPTPSTTAEPLLPTKSLTNSESLTTTTLQSTTQSTTKVDLENKTSASEITITLLIAVLVTIFGLIFVIVVVVIVVIILKKSITMKKQRTQTDSYAGLHAPGSRESEAPDPNYDQLDHENNSPEDSYYETIPIPEGSNYDRVIYPENKESAV